MELLNGPSLRRELAERGPLPLAETVAMVVTLAGALQCAHEQGVLHRDIKPANIVAHDFSSAARVRKIVDFGLARAIHEPAPTRSASADDETTRLTAANQFIGTVAYAAPEQILARSTDARSDVYSLAVVTFELLTGRLPIEATDLTQFAVTVTRPVPRPSSIRADLPAWVDIVLGRALALNPDDRYDSAAAFGEALSAGAGRTGGHTVPAVTGPAAGGLLATYDLGPRIGAGRLGSDVVRGVHRALGHPVAIRLLRRSADRDWDAVRSRFLREAHTLQVAHPSIIQVRDYGEDGDLVYLVTDLIEGPSLRQMLEADGPLPWTRAQPLVSQLLEAARTLHKHGGLLCGAGPEIIRLENDEEGPRLMLSTAGVCDAKDLLATLGDVTLRGRALVDAELHYVAPEILTGEHADVRSDVFTIGVLAYEMTTGVRPYEGASIPALLGAMLRGEPRHPRELQPTLPSHVADAILKALSPDPGARQASAATVAQEIAGTQTV
jgi:serine/threonine protein kinase